MQPPASLKALGDPIYEAFYGLTEQPFAITTDPRFFYLGSAHQRAFSELLNGLRRRESLLLLTGETGSGKTTLCRAVLDALGDRTFAAIVLNPYMSGAEVFRIILRDFGFVSHEDLRRGVLASADVSQLVDMLEGFLRTLLPFAGHAVVVIDEAQALSPTTLDQIRLLTGLEHDRRPLVNVVLCGQPALQNTIKHESLQALNERITRRIELGPLTPADVHGYIVHRLSVAGAGDAVRFDEPATAAIADLSRGLPRRVNVLCDRALQEGRVEGASVISLDILKRAARAVAGVYDPLPAPSFSEPTAAPAPVPTPPPAPLPAPVPVRPAAASLVPATPIPAPIPPPRVVDEPEPITASPVAPDVDEETAAASNDDLEDDPTPAPPDEATAMVGAIGDQAEHVETSRPVSTLPEALDLVDEAQREERLPSFAATPEGPIEEERAGRSSRELPELTFGQERPAADRRPLYKAAAVLAGVATLVVGGYFGWALMIGPAEGIVPAAPTIRVLTGGAPALALPIPPVEETDAMFASPRPFARPVAPETPDDVVAPPVDPAAVPAPPAP